MRDQLIFPSPGEPVRGICATLQDEGAVDPAKHRNRDDRREVSYGTI